MSDSSEYYETTYSEDERYEEWKRIQEKEKVALELARKDFFNKYFEGMKKDFASTLYQPGLEMITFRSDKIKFGLTPREIVKYVNYRVRFFCTLRFGGSVWTIRRNTLPLDCKMKIYETLEQDRIIDQNVMKVIDFIYETFIEWCNLQQEWRIDKFQRYKDGEDVELDEDDQEMFLNDGEREELRAHRNAIWKRMLPYETVRKRQRRMSSPSS